jgi:hypothetical protein
MSRTRCYELFKRFKEGRMSVGEDPRPGRPSTSLQQHFSLLLNMACTRYLHLFNHYQTKYDLQSEFKGI